MSSNKRLAFDIETVSPDVPKDKYPDFEDHTDFEVLAVAAGLEGVEENHRVFFRNGWGKESELALITAVVDHMQEIAPSGTEVITYNGTKFDFNIIFERTKDLTRDLNDDGQTENNLRNWIRGISHTDLKPPAWNRWGEYTSLEDSLQNSGIDVHRTEIADFDHGLDHQQWRSSPGPTYIEGSDVAIIGETYLDWVDEGRKANQFTALEEMIDDYARSDISELFDLADNLESQHEK